MEPTQIRLTIPDSVDPLYLTGPADSLLREIEASCAALISVRGKAIFLSGTSQEIEQLTLIFSHLIQMVESGSRPTLEDVKLLLDSTKRNANLEQTGTRTLFVTHKGKAIQPKTQGQIEYTKAIANNSITFGIGPAGTGKTYLAVAMALAALTSQQISRIVLVRPVVEAGESLGFLPGTLQEKLDPYIRPLYDALFDMTSMEYASNLIEQGIVEIAPLAFMRGRTMNDAFVILDEAQNTTPEQMKMFLTRLGFSSKFVITGDATQRDLVGRSGLDVARQVLGNLEDVAFVDLDRNDIVRHTLVGKIVDAYTAYEKKQLGSNVVNEYDIVIEEGVESPISVEEIEADCNLVLSEEGVERPCTVSISIVSDTEIQKVNLEWREKNAPTDVISLEVERPDDPDLAPGEMCELGDIILAPHFIARQAKEYGTTEADEFRLMLVHAMLHLLGYDHIEDDEAEIMEAREDALVALLSTDRTIEPVVLTRHREGIDE